MSQKEDLAPSHAKAFKGHLSCGNKAALLIVDVVKAYVEPDSPLFLPGSGATALTSNIKLAHAAREAGIVVILTNVEYDASGRNGGQFFKKVPALKCFIKGSALGNFPKGLHHDADILVTKQYASSFFGTSLASTLRSMEIDTLLITGFSTSGCVRATAVDAIQNGFIPFVVKDACADRAQRQHDANLSDIDAKYGEVISEQEALRILAS